MSSASNNWLSLFLPALKKHADRTIIRPYLGSSPEPSWGRITYHEWDQQLAAMTAHYRATLSILQPGDIIGVWLTGRKWTDLLHICAVSAAGFVPQLFSSVFTTDMIKSLLAMSGAKAVVYDPDAFPDAQRECAIPAWPALAADELADGHLELGQPQLVPVRERDPCAIFHSSGTTSGMPKLIPTSHLLMKTFIEQKFPDCLIDDDHDPSSYVYNSLGSLAHVGSFQCFHATAVHGACTVQASSMAMAPAEMLHMVRACGLTSLVQYATFVSAHIRAARDSDEVREVLMAFRQVLYTGVALPEEDERCAMEWGVRLSVMFGTSETAPLLIAKPSPGEPLLLRPCAGASPIFIPYTPSDSPSNNSDLSSTTSDTPRSTSEPSTRPPLYELIVAPSAPDAPPPALFSADGYWHTHDLFERVPSSPSSSSSPPSSFPSPSGSLSEIGWIHRGRADDWLKTVPGFVDTRALEDAVRRTCADVVADALVVGAGRMHPVLLVELSSSSSSSDATSEEEEERGEREREREREVRELVVQRIRAAGACLFPYERIEDPSWVVVVRAGGIVRTREKGNARREATERLYKDEIDAIYN